MKLAAPLLGLCTMMTLGCGAARSVGHVVAAPVRLVHGSDDHTPPRSDVDRPGRPVAATPTPRPKVVQRKSKSQPSPSPATAPRMASAQPQFPVAKVVPGKPGLVYNPFDPKGGLIDVSGYAPGSKVKDPDSQKIFVVP